ncbi:MAG: BrnT family toxin [Candidatus Competibacteraceae bacterium]
MKFTWNSAKRRANLKKHGFDFAEAERVFDGPTVTVEDPRDYGSEQRFNSTGFLGTAIVTICHTETEDEIHIISMRKATSDEIHTLAQYL